MNKRIFALTLIAACLCSSAKACWYGTYDAKHYLTYRVFPEVIPSEENCEEENDATKNCRLWQKKTAQDIPLQDIREVVYSWDASMLQELSQNNGKGNRFARWIAANDTEVVDFLILAKNVEDLRAKANDPWYYPYEGDHLSTQLEDACDKARAAMKGRLHDRYLLQLVRVLKTLKRDREIIELWTAESITEPLLRKMISGYVAGAYYSCGKYDKAMEMYATCGDATSIQWCLQAQGHKADILAVMDRLADNPDNYQQVLVDLQKFVTRLEIKLEAGVECEAEIDRLMDIANRHTMNSPTRQKAFWHYTESYAYWLKADMDNALKAIKKAEAAEGDLFIKQSAHTLRLLIESRTLPVGKSYDAWLMGASQWLIEQAKKEKDIVAWDDVTFFRNTNLSHCYQADMLRKMVLGYAVSRFLEARDTIRALQATDMADHVLMPESVIKEMSSHDNATFAFADMLSANTIIRFVNRIEKPKDRYDSFYNRQGSGCNLDYWYDIAGTMLIRETRYEEAIPWLERVSEAYRAKMAILSYCDTNPFALQLISDAQCHQKEVLQPVRNDYKLWFARMMTALRKGYEKERDTNKRAMMQLQYAVGMRNSVYPCWPLTQYYWGKTIYGSAADIGDFTEFSVPEYFHYDYWPYRIVNRHERQFRTIRRRSTKLMDAALSTFTDREQLASAQWAMGNYKTVARHFADTRFAGQKRGRCDRWKDYENLN